MIFSAKSNSCLLATDADDDASCKWLSQLGGSASSGGTGLSYTIKGFWDAGVPTAPPTFAQQGLNCEVSTISTSECVTNTFGEVTCNVIGKLSGNATNTTPNTKATDAECPNGVCPPIQQNTTANNNPCVYSGSSTEQSCTSQQETQKDGKQDCGTVNGKTTCIYQKPSSNVIKIDTNVKTTTETDGSKTSVKTDNATKTTCTDVKKCTSTTSKTTTTSKTNGSGVSTSTTSTCTGTCGANGTGLESVSSTGTGTGNATGDEGDGDGGDAGSLKDPQNGSFDPQVAEWDDKLTKAKTDLKDSLTKIKSAFQPIGDTSLSGGAGAYIVRLR
ncbi:hypothetical protein [Pseudomonas huanghezhanensis]|uniref:hypothetical protein n=1 Tax=Pseudomonas huanghezhanensis TaxID=3002903 RepID=UPI00228666B1|nr:hypothetical protein [Pseudomonas sp. BSw22131]